MAHILQEIFQGGQEQRRAKVQEGESLWSIAKKNNASVSALRHYNKLDDVNVLQPGQELLIPNAAKGTTGNRVRDRINRQSVRQRGHVAADFGDTLSSIAGANGLTVQELKEVNPHIRGDKLMAGQDVYVAYGGMKKGLEETCSNVLDNLQDAMEDCYVAANRLNAAKTRKALLSLRNRQPNSKGKDEQNTAAAAVAAQHLLEGGVLDENGEPLVAIGALGGAPSHLARDPKKLQEWLDAREDDRQWFLSTAPDKENDGDDDMPKGPKRGPHHTSNRIESQLKEMEKMKASTSGRGAQGSKDLVLADASNGAGRWGMSAGSSEGSAGAGGRLAPPSSSSALLLEGGKRRAGGAGGRRGSKEGEDPDNIDGAERGLASALEGLQKAGGAFLTWCSTNNVVEVPEGFTIRATVNTGSGGLGPGGFLQGLFRAGPSFGRGAGAGTLVPSGGGGGINLDLSPGALQGPGGIVGAVQGLVGQLLDNPIIANGMRVQRAAAMAGSQGLMALGPATGGAGGPFGGANPLAAGGAGGGFPSMASLRQVLVGAAARAAGGGSQGGFTIPAASLAGWKQGGGRMLLEGPGGMGGAGGGRRGASVIFGGVGGSALVAMPEGSTFSISMGGAGGGGMGGASMLGAMGEAMSRVGSFLSGERPTALPSVSALRTLPALSGGMMGTAHAVGGASWAAASAFDMGTGAGAGAMVLSTGDMHRPRNPRHKRSMSSPAELMETLGLEKPGAGDSSKRAKLLLKGAADAQGAAAGGKSADYRAMDAAAKRQAFEDSIRRAGERAERRAAAEGAAAEGAAPSPVAESPAPKTPAPPSARVPEVLNSPGANAAMTPMPKSGALALRAPEGGRALGPLLESPAPRIPSTPMLGPPLRVPRSLGELGEVDPDMKASTPDKLRMLWRRGAKKAAKKARRYMGSCVGAGVPPTPGTDARLGGPTSRPLLGDGSDDIRPRRLYKKKGFFGVLKRAFGAGK